MTQEEKISMLEEMLELENGTLSPEMELSSIEEYDSMLPKPYMHETEATMMTSFSSKTLRVAPCRIRSICSLMAESFSIYVSVEAIYASGW